MLDIKNLFSLANKVAFISGATGYLGTQIALSLSQHGAHLIVNGRNPSKVNFLIKQIERMGGSAEPAIFDISKINDVKKYFESRESSQAINILINCAYSGFGGNIVTSTPEMYQSSYETIVIGAHNLLISSLPFLNLSVKSTNDASVINISSMYGLVSPNLNNYESPLLSNPPFYGAAKAALIQLTRYAACEFGACGIRVNCISPGPFPNIEKHSSQDPLIKKLAESSPLNRVGNPIELCGPVIFLASSASSYVTGANILVDGGWTSW